MQALPDFVMNNRQYFNFTNESDTVKESAPFELKKKFEIWYNNSGLYFDRKGFKDPWYTWDGKVIEKSERSKRPEFKKH